MFDLFYSPLRKFGAEPLEKHSTRERYNSYPEILDGLHHANELIEVDGFLDVAIRSQPIGVAHVLISRGSCKHYQRNFSEGRVAFDFTKHFPTVYFRQVQIEQNQIRRCSIIMPASPVQHIQRFHAIPRDGEIHQASAFFECFASKPHIGRVVFYKQNIYRFDIRVCGYWATIVLRIHADRDANMLPSSF